MDEGSIDDLEFQVHTVDQSPKKEANQIIGSPTKSRIVGMIERRKQEILRKSYTETISFVHTPSKDDELPLG